MCFHASAWPTQHFLCCSMELKRLWFSQIVVFFVFSWDFYTYIYIHTYMGPDTVLSFKFYIRKVTAQLPRHTIVTVQMFTQTLPCYCEIQFWDFRWNLASVNVSQWPVQTPGSGPYRCWFSRCKGGNGLARDRFRTGHGFRWPAGAWWGSSGACCGVAPAHRSWQISFDSLATGS